MSPLRVVSMVVGAAALTCAAVAARSVRVEVRSLRSTSSAVPRVSPDAWYDSVKDLDLRTPRGVVLHGWLRGSTNGAFVLLVDGSAADRRQLLPEAHLLSARGYGVLMFDRPGNGESGGERYRGDEADFLRVAVDTLASNPSLREGEIGAYGFSSGAAFLAEAAASDPRLKGVILAGCYTDGGEYIRHFGGRGPISGVPGLWAVEWEKATLPRPLARMPGIAPRALFFIAGDEDSVVPADLSQELYAAASEPKELWIIHGAHHGEYRQVAGEEFDRRMVAFYDRALLGHEASR